MALSVSELWVSFNAEILEMKVWNTVPSVTRALRADDELGVVGRSNFWIDRTTRYR